MQEKILFKFHPAQSDEYFQAPCISTTPYLFYGIEEAFLIGGVVILALILLIAPTLYEVIKNAG